MSRSTRKLAGVDRVRLEKAKKRLGAVTAAEAADRALDLVLTDAEPDATLRKLRRQGRLTKVFR